MHSPRRPLRYAATAALCGVGIIGGGVFGLGALPARAADPGPPYDKIANCVADRRAIEPVEDGVSPGQRLMRHTQVWGFSQGAGVTVAVIDTGVAPGPAFGERLVAGGDLVVPTSPTPGLEDCDGHGTLVAGIIAGAPDTASGFAGVAPAARVLSIRHNSLAYAVKGSTDPGVGTSRTLAAAIDLAVARGADVVNVSSAYCGPALTANDPTLSAAVRRAVAADVVVVVAAGNLGSSDTCSTQNSPGTAPVTGATPANIPEALTVGAVDGHGQPADFSLAGSWVDVAAPGASIVSTNPHPSQSGQVGALVGPRGDQPIQGTSFSAPYVSGVVALIRARFPNLTAIQVIARIEATADHPSGPGGRSIYVGHGVVNPVRALTAVLPAELAGLAEPTRASASDRQVDRASTLAPAPATPARDGSELLALIGSAGLLTGLVLAILARVLRRRGPPARVGAVPPSPGRHSDRPGA